ncbi:hypothetical protein, partial [uncultured Algibacter sp.]|uniref:hypothetical protein n=1 Tax=uncultured Algibacter sp. TaxID=298659 RepID=UPI002611B558
HLDLWKPARKHFLSNLAEQDQPVVFVLFGEGAMKTFFDVEPLCNRSIIVVQAHPRSQQFFEFGQNPLVRANLG